MLAKAVAQAQNAPLSIRLTEPITFLRSSATGEDFRGRRQWVQQDAPPAMLRGILTVRLAKPCRIKKIDIRLEGKARTEWPEGIGARRTDTYEEKVILSESIIFFNAAEQRQSSLTRRAMSVGPGTMTYGEEWDLGDDENDEEMLDEQDELEELNRGRGRNMAHVAPRSYSMAAERTGSVRSMIRPRLGDRDITSSRSLRDDDVEEEGSAEEDNRASSARKRLNPSVDQLTRERGPSPAYSFHNPMNRERRGRTASVRGSRPPFSRDTGSAEEMDIGEAGLSTIPSAEPSRRPSPDGEAGHGSGRVLVNGSGVRFERNADDMIAEGDEPPSRRTSVAVENGTNGNGLSSSPESAHLSSETGLAPRPPSHPNGSASPHPLHTRIMSAGPSQNASRTSLSTLSGTAADPLVEVTRRGSGQSSLTEMVPAGSVPPNELAPTSSHDESISSSTRRLSGLRPKKSIPNILGVNGTRARTPSASSVAPPVSSPSQAQATLNNDAANQERGRGSGSKFSFANALRNLSRGGSRSRTRGSSQVPPSAPSATFVDPLLRSASRRGESEARDGRIHQLTVDEQEFRPYGRGGAGRSPSQPRTSSPAGSKDRSASRGRGRNMGMKALGMGSEDGESVDGGSNWKEFRRGVYNYPISFAIPPNAPPTIHGDFGAVTYKLKATVHRVGTLTPNFTEDLEVAMIATPQEDDLEETENILVERQWEDQMRYLIALSGKAFTIGGQIPMSIRIMPMSKCKIYRLSATIEEKLDYYAMERKVARHEAPKRYNIVTIKGVEDKSGPKPLIPIISDAADAIYTSPLAAMAMQARQTDETEDDAFASLLNPVGPWNLETMLQVPDCMSRIRFSTKHESTNMTATHFLKIVLRVQRGDDEALDSKGRRKQFDIIIETPLHLLDCRANTTTNSLPSYNFASAGSNTTSQPTCRVHGKGATSVPIDSLNIPNPQNTTITRASHSPSPAAIRGGRSVSTQRGRSESTGPLSNGSEASEPPDTLLERNIVFDRLVSGQQTEAGECPPTYDEALRNRSRQRSASRNTPRGRSESRLRAEVHAS